MQKAKKYAGGLELNFVNSAAFEAVKTSDTHEKWAGQARNFLRLLMMGWNDNWRELFSWRLFKAIFVKRDAQLTQEMRLAFQQGFQHVFTQLQDKKLTDLQHNQAQLFISNCLTYLPFADLNPYESFAIPQWIDNKWQLIDYKVVPIELTPTSGFKKVFIAEKDRVFAYGLEPINNSQAEPHLIFMGTTYPAGQGFVSMVNTDLEPFETVGKKLYRTGRENIAHWLDKQPKKAHVCGASLGGALSLLLAIDQGEKLSRVDALNPPGLYKPWRKSRFDRWDTLATKPDVYVQKQGKDFVSSMGVWKEDWHVLHVTPPITKRGPTSGTEHVLNYAGLANTQFIEIDAKKDNKERWLKNSVLTLARSLLYYTISLPYRYIIRPSVKFVWDNKALIILSLPMIALALLIPPLTFVLAIPPVIAAIPLFKKIYPVAKTLLGSNEVKAPLFQQANHPRHASLNIYTNTMEATFTYKEIGSYYQAKRCLLKNKPLVPAEENNRLSVFATSGLKKRDVLQQCQDPVQSETQVTLKGTKAKIDDMRRTLRLVQKIGFHQPEKLKAELQKNQQEYSAGKYCRPA